MKKLSIFTFAAIFSIFAISCNNGENKDKEDEKTPEEETKAQIVDLESFNEAYETLEFEECDEFKTAMGHYMDIYFSTLDKAVEGDETAIEEFKELHEMKCTFEKQAEKLNDECPDKMSELGEKYEEEQKAHADEINQILSPEDAESEKESPENNDEEGGEDSKSSELTKKGQKSKSLNFEEKKLDIDDSQNKSDE